MKIYYTQENIGKVRYVVNFYDGIKKHKDGSPFFDIHTSHNKKDRDKFIKELIEDGYKYRSSGLLTAEEKWPEYAKEANEIAMNACRAINNASIALYRDRGIKCSYPAQCLLEMVVKDLEARI